MFEVGQEVWDTVLGKGSVWCISMTSAIYPVRVKFDNELTESYNFQGKCAEKNKRSLFFSEPTVTAELFPPKKPSKSVLKAGDLIAIKDEHSSDVVIVSFLKEDEGRIHYAYTDGQMAYSHDYSHKENVSVYPLGEEIKFES